MDFAPDTKWVRDLAIHRKKRGWKLHIGRLEIQVDRMELLVDCEIPHTEAGEAGIHAIREDSHTLYKVIDTVVAVEVRKYSMQIPEPNAIEGVAHNLRGYGVRYEKYFVKT